MERRPDLFKAQLFLDDTWIEDSLWVLREWHQPRKYPEPVLVAEHPWERKCPVMYGSVLYWRGRFRMWYCGWTRSPLPRACYAESEDGVLWEKPSLGICEFQGSKDNNIILDSAFGEWGLIDCLTVIDDPEDEGWPLKMLYWDGHGRPPKTASDIYAARSKDGIHWDRSPGIVLPGWSDRFNAMSEKQDGKYVVYGRASVRDESTNGRRVWRTESEDLTHWSEAKLIFARDVEDPPLMQYYSMVAFPYESLYLGAIERMHVAPDKLDSELVFSHDGYRWQRSRTRSAFLSWGPENAFDSAWVNLPANGPILVKNLLWFYYSGRSGAHHTPYPLNRGSIGLSVLRIDGFASLRADAREGFVLTPPMEWPAGDLIVNFDPRPDARNYPLQGVGELRVEIRGEDNQPLAGFTWDECTPLQRGTRMGENPCRPIVWGDRRSLRELAGRRVRLAFRLREGHLYSFRAGDAGGA